MPTPKSADEDCAHREEMESQPAAALTASVLELLHALNSEHQRLVQLCAGEEEPHGTV